MSFNQKIKKIYKTIV